jgi:hypothetical protein
MYPLPISMIAGASLHLSSASAQGDVPRVPDILPPAAALSAEDTPPPPVAAPLEPVRAKMRFVPKCATPMCAPPPMAL